MSVDRTVRKVIVKITTPQGEETLALGIPGAKVRDEDIDAGLVRMSITGVSRAEELPPGRYFSE